MDVADCGGLSPSLCKGDSSGGTAIDDRCRVMRAGVGSIAWDSSASVLNLCTSRLSGAAVSFVGLCPVSFPCLLDSKRAATDDVGSMSLLPNGLFERGAAVAAPCDIAGAGF